MNPKSSCLSLLREICGIPSPTYEERSLVAFIKTILEPLRAVRIREYKDGLIVEFPTISKKKPHISLLGHGDVVCPYFKPVRKGNRFHGAGASDMKGSLAIFMRLMKTYAEHHQECPYRLSFVLYSREEGTTLVDNGLYALIRRYPPYFRSIDLAIVGEPTNNHLHLGAMGSLHAKVVVKGQAAHSARPWDGENALYKALPFLQDISNYPVKPYRVGGVVFKEVMTVTESQSTPGTTTIPREWTANVNYRYAPNKSLQQAKTQFIQTLGRMGIVRKNVQIIGESYAGRMLSSPLMQAFIQALRKPITAKQAWTDVAQLTHMGIPAINYGPGKTKQAHKPYEYILLSDMERYETSLEKFLSLRALSRPCSLI